MAYERKVLGMLGQKWPGLLHYHQWINYQETRGDDHHWCEPDLFLVARDAILLIEIKLSATPEAFLQMAGLYAPLLSHLYEGRPVRQLQVCKYINAECPGPRFESPEAFISSSSVWGTWNWRDD